MAFAMRFPTASPSTCASPRTYSTARPAAHHLDAGGVGLDGVRLERRGDDLVHGDHPLLGELVGRLQPREVHDARGQQRETGRLGGQTTGEDRAPGRGSSAADSMASASRLTAPTGVFSSWLVFATKSRRICSHALALGDVADHEQGESR